MDVVSELPIGVLILALPVGAIVLLAVAALVGTRAQKKVLTPQSLQPRRSAAAGAVAAVGQGVLVAVFAAAAVALVTWVLWGLGGGWLGTEEQQNLEIACQAQADAAGLPSGQQWLDFVDDCKRQGG